MDKVRKVSIIVKISKINNQLHKLLDFSFVPSKRRHGVGHFCGNELYLLGGLTKHRLANELIEKFRLENGKLCHTINSERPIINVILTIYL